MDVLIALSLNVYKSPAVTAIPKPNRSIFANEILMNVSIGHQQRIR